MFTNVMLKFEKHLMEHNVFSHIKYGWHICIMIS